MNIGANGDPKIKIPFLRAFKIWSGGKPPSQPFYCVIDRIKKDPTGIFTYLNKTSLVKCNVGLECIDKRWVVDEELFEKALQERNKLVGLDSGKAI